MDPDKEKRLILQPMSRAECLREYLFQHGFALEEEEIVMNNRRLYTVMQVFFTGRITHATPLDALGGTINRKQIAACACVFTAPGPASAQLCSGTRRKDI